MDERFDAVVIGAGIGGLTAAANLVREGLRVLVLERMPRPGGTASTFKRGAFSFPMGPLGFSSPDLVTASLRELGVGEGLEFRRVHYRLMAYGVGVDLSQPYPGLAADLASAFGVGRDDLVGFFRDVESVAREIREAAGAGRAPALAVDYDVPASRYVGRMFGDRRLQRVLAGMGTTEPGYGFPLLAAMWDLMSRVGIYYPEGGFPSLVERLVLAVTGGRPSKEVAGCARGGGGGHIGEIRLGARAERVLVKGSKVAGVALAGGTSIETPFVVSNADYKTTFLKLVDSGDVPADWRRAVLGARYSRPVIQVCLGIEAGRADLSAFEGASRIIYRAAGAEESAGPHWEEKEIDPSALASQELEVSLWSADDPGLAGEGGAVIVIRVPVDYAHFARMRHAPGHRSAGYEGYKKRLAVALVRAVSEMIPGLEDSVAVMDVGTPLTFEERCGRYAAAAAGWSWEYDDSSDMVPRELVLTPVKGLYMAGHQAMSLLYEGGVPAAVKSGERVATAVLDEERPSSDFRGPGPRSA